MKCILFAWIYILFLESKRSYVWNKSLKLISNYIAWVSFVVCSVNWQAAPRKMRYVHLNILTHWRLPVLVHLFQRTSPRPHQLLCLNNSRFSGKFSLCPLEKSLFSKWGKWKDRFFWGGWVDLLHGCTTNGVIWIWGGSLSHALWDEAIRVK